MIRSVVLSIIASRGLNLRPANVLQRLFAQDIGIAFPGFGERDDLPGDGVPDEIVGVFGPQSEILCLAGALHMPSPLRSVCCRLGDIVVERRHFAAVVEQRCGGHPRLG
jgi:hypothetical protein